MDLVQMRSVTLCNKRICMYVCMYVCTMLLDFTRFSTMTELGQKMIVKHLAAKFSSSLMFSCRRTLVQFYHHLTK